MIINKLTIKGFQSFREEVTIGLEGTSFAVITGQNGSGKSSIFDAISWTLFGKTRVQQDRDSIINDETEVADCTIDLQLIDGTLMRVRREREWNSTTRLTIHEYSAQDREWLQFNDHRIAPSQAHIYDQIGMTEDAFFSICSIEQGSMITGTRFTAAKSSQRRAILMSLLHELDEWPVLEGIIADKHRDLNREVEDHERDLEALDAKSDEIKSDIEDSKRLLDSMKSQEDLETSIVGVEESISSYQKAIDASSEGREELAAQRDALVAQRRARNAEIKSETIEVKGKIKEIDAAHDKLESLQDDLEDSKKRAADLDQKIEDLATEIAELEVRSTKTSSGVTEWDDTIESLTDKVSVLRASRKDIEAKVEALELQSNKGGDAVCLVCDSPLSEDKADSLCHKAEDDLKDLQSKLEEASSDLDDAKDSKSRATRRHDKIVSSIADLEKAHDRAVSSLESTAESNVSMKAKIVAAQQAVDELPDREVLVGRLELLVPEKETEAEVKLADDLDKMDSEHPLSPKLKSAVKELKSLRDDLATIHRTEGKVSNQRDERKKLRSSSKEIRSRIKDAGPERSYLEKARQACGQKGVPSMLLGEILASIEDEQNAILREMLGDNAFQVEFRQERENKSNDGIKQELDIIVHTPNGLDRPIETFSGGERVRLTLSNLFAMVKVFNGRRPGLVRTLFLDEPLGQLDNDALPIVLSIFRDMINTGVVDSILLMSHQEKIIDDAPQRIVVSRNDATENTSMVEVD